MVRGGHFLSNKKNAFKEQINTDDTKVLGRYKSNKKFGRFALNEKYANSLMNMQ